MRRLKTLRRPPIYPKTPGHLPCSSLTHPLPLSSRRPSVSFGGFGLRKALTRLSYRTSVAGVKAALALAHWDGLDVPAKVLETIDDMANQKTMSGRKTADNQ